MPTFVFTNHAEDGTSHKCFPTAPEALKAMAEMGGFAPDTLQVGRFRTDDWGRRMGVEEWAETVTTKEVTAYYEAYDARECGTLTPAQQKLLDRIEIRR